MALFGHAVERVVDAGLDARRVFGRQAQGTGDLVGRLETDAVDVLHQPVGCGLDHGQRVVAVLLVDLHRQVGGYAVAVEKDHHVLNRSLLLPGLDNAINPLLADAQHLAQPFRLLVDHVQGLRAEAVNDAFGHHLAYAADHARAEIALDALCRRRDGLLTQLHLELAAVPGMVQPLAGQLQPFARVDLWQVADDGDELVAMLAVGVGQHPARVRLQAQDGVAILLIVVGNALNTAAELLAAFHRAKFTPFRPSLRDGVE